MSHGALPPLILPSTYVAENNINNNDYNKNKYTTHTENTHTDNRHNTVFVSKPLVRNESDVSGITSVECSGERSVERSLHGGNSVGGCSGQPEDPSEGVMDVCRSSEKINERNNEKNDGTNNDNEKMKKGGDNNDKNNDNIDNIDKNNMNKKTRIKQDGKEKYREGKEERERNREGREVRERREGREGREDYESEMNDNCRAICLSCHADSNRESQTRINFWIRLDEKKEVVYENRDFINNYNNNGDIHNIDDNNDKNTVENTRNTLKITKPPVNRLNKLTELLISASKMTVETMYDFSMASKKGGANTNTEGSSILGKGKKNQNKQVLYNIFFMWIYFLYKLQNTHVDR